MAKPASFDEANLVLLAPPECEDSVVDMPVRRLDGAIVSSWELDPEEISEVVRTGRIWLSVWGRQTSPPVMVTAFKDEVI